MFMKRTQHSPIKTINFFCRSSCSPTVSTPSRGSPWPAPCSWPSPSPSSDTSPSTTPSTTTGQWTTQRWAVLGWFFWSFFFLAPEDVFCVSTKTAHLCKPYCAVQYIHRRKYRNIYSYSSKVRSDYLAKKAYARSDLPLLTPCRERIIFSCGQKYFLEEKNFFGCVCVRHFLSHFPPFYSWAGPSLLLPPLFSCNLIIRTMK